MPDYTDRHYQIARDYALVARNGLLNQDVITPDNKMRVSARRIGSGFTQGHNVYDVTLDDRLILHGVDGYKACTALYLYAIGAF